MAIHSFQDRPGTPDRLSADTLSRLRLARWVLLGVEGLGVLLLTLTPMAATVSLSMMIILALHAGLGWLNARREPGEGDPAGAFAALAADAAAIAGLVYFSGGYANPFISLLLLPLLLCAVVLPARYAWAMTAWVSILYSLLARYYQPLALHADDSTAIDLHLAGMWLNFLITAGVVAAFVARLAGALRQREADLARERERALRDQQLFALGMQAAAAAHDLATPLATLRLSLDDLARDYAGDDELGPGLTLMRAQAERLTAVLDRLAASAGAAHPDGSGARPLDEWLRETFDHWHLMRPRAAAAVRIDGPHPAPRLCADPVLRAALVSVLATLLNNAADASPEAVTLAATWDAERLSLHVLDRGPGFAPSDSKPGGWGVGLRLAEAALDRYAGRLAMSVREGGGLDVQVSLPLDRLCPPESP